MIKTVTLKGSELKVEGLGGFNTFVQNLGGTVIYASKYSGITAGADNVAEIPTGSGKLINSTNGTVYLLGMGKAELTGLDGDGVIAAGGAAAYSGGSDSVDGAALAELMNYADVGDEETLEAAKEYALSLAQNKADKSEIPEIPEIPTALPANGGNADTVGGFTVGCDVPEDAVFTDTIVDISGKMDAANPVATGSFSLGRKADTETGVNSFAQGLDCSATGNYSHAIGHAAKATNYASFACGKYCKDMAEGATAKELEGDVVVVGNGYKKTNGSITYSNAFRISYLGLVYSDGAINSTGADYAEFIKPWSDGNPNNEDRVGYFVTIKNGGLCFAEEGDYIVGITSGNPSVVGNGDEDWLGRWQRDEFSRILMEDGHFKANPEYDPSQKYIERKDRPEWDYVGMTGVVPVRDDGTCAAGGFAKCGAGGVATAADEWECHKTFFVIERVNENVIKVEMR